MTQSIHEPQQRCLPSFADVDLVAEIAFEWAEFLLGPLDPVAGCSFLGGPFCFGLLTGCRPLSAPLASLDGADLPDTGDTEEERRPAAAAMLSTDDLPSEVLVLSNTSLPAKCSGLIPSCLGSMNLDSYSYGIYGLMDLWKFTIAEKAATALVWCLSSQLTHN